MKLIAKMSVKGVGCYAKAITAVKPQPGVIVPPLDLCDIYGVAAGIKTGESANGDFWSALVGEFEGRNLDDPKMEDPFFRSGKLFLPGGIHEAIEEPLKAAEDRGEKASIKFAFRISVVQAENPQGYAYQARPLFAVHKDDPLAALRKAIGHVVTETLPQLPQGETSAPQTKQIEQAPEPAPTPIPLPPAIAPEPTKPNKRR